MARIALFLTDNERCRRCSVLSAILYQPWLEDRIKTLPTAKLRNLEVPSRVVRAHPLASRESVRDGPDVDGTIGEEADFFLLRSMATKDGAEGSADGDEVVPRDKQTPSSDGVRLWRDAPTIGRIEMGLWQELKLVASMSGPGLQISQPPTPKQTPSHKGGRVVWGLERMKGNSGIGQPKTGLE